MVRDFHLVSNAPSCKQMEIESKSATARYIFSGIFSFPISRTFTTKRPFARNSIYVSVKGAKVCMEVYGKTFGGVCPIEKV